MGSCSTTDNVHKKLLFKSTGHRNTMLLGNNEMSQMQKDLIKAKDTNITIKPMKINTPIKNTISIDSTKTEKS